MREHIVPHSVGAMALPRYFARAYPMAPSWSLRDAWKKRDIRINGIRVDNKGKVSDCMVHGGDVLQIYLPDKYLAGTLRILLEDEESGIVAVEKPVGLPVDTDELQIGEDTVLTRFRAMKEEYVNGCLCHRLDAGTGGALLLATDENAARCMQEKFSRGDIHKFYQAIVIGKPAPKENPCLVHYLKKDAASSLVTAYTRPVPGAREAKLRYTTLHNDFASGVPEGCTVVEIELFTGRTHQIRAQMAKIGYPLLGDDKYGNRTVNRQLGVMTPQLWCVRMHWDHFVVTSPAPFYQKET